MTTTKTRIASRRGRQRRDPDLTVPADPAQRPGYEAAFARFCAVFPDAFYRLRARPDDFDREKERQDKGRLLSAGFHT